MRFARNRQSHARELVVLLGRNEPVSSRQLKRALGSAHDNLLAFRAEQGRRPATTRLFYDVSGLTSLKGYVRRSKLSGEDLLSMLESLVEALTWCGLDGNGRFSMMFDSAYVFVGLGCKLHFVYLPMAGMYSASIGSPLELLGVLGEVDKLAFSSPNASEISRSIAGFVLDSDGVFSLNALRRFSRQVRGSNASLGRADSGLQARGSSPSSLILRRVKTGQTYELGEGSVVQMGRATCCDVRVLGNPGISREHACITYKEGTVFLWDVGSKNGTVYGNARLRPNQRVSVSPGTTFYLDTEAFLVGASDSLAS